MTTQNEGPFDEQGHVEEAKFYPKHDLESITLEPGELPSFYGQNRLVLLTVDPYTIYSYWQLTEDLPPTGGARAVLRFYQDPGRPFDVEIDLGAGNWYVHLWSPDKVYQADLGLRGEDGAFTVLAESNAIRTPPAKPAPEAPRAPAPVELAPVELAPVELAPVEVVPDPCVTDFSLSAVFAGTDFTLPEDLGEVFEDAVSPVEVDAFPLSELPVHEGGMSDLLLPFDLADLDELDLTEYAEQRFTAGVSSQGGALGN